MEEMAKLDTLAYESPAEALAERFHMARALLEALNPGADYGKAGTQILVTATKVRVLEGKVARIEVDGANSTLRAYGAEDKLLATFPATVGSSEFPSPSGRMTVRTLAPDPVYYFSPEGRSWGPDRKLTIAAGPNNPVGSTWIDLSEEGYGIHGTPDPRLIGKTASHGCVRLTNWDAKALGKAIEVGTVVEFI
jgi:lipoprotein-anchoring transpeptidase ErfK/SrfK